MDRLLAAIRGERPRSRNAFSTNDQMLVAELRGGHTLPQAVHRYRTEKCTMIIEEADWRRPGAFTLLHSRDWTLPNQMKTAVVLIDHGSKVAASNQLLHDVAERFRLASEFSLVEPAHMELAMPNLDEAFARCVDQGASKIVVHPYFFGARAPC